MFICRLNALPCSFLASFALLVSSSSVHDIRNSPVELIENVNRRSLPLGWTSLGCYTDSANPRTLSANSHFGSNVSAETCSAFCSAYAYAGMEYSDECYCGDTLAGGSTAVSSTQCTMLCTGDSQEICGGPNLLTLLQQSTVLSVAPPSTLASFNTWVSLGCYTDSTSARTLSHATAVTGPLTVEACLNACQAAGYPLAGVEFSTECYCGPFLSNGGAPASSGCTMACAGNSTELCGGPNRLNVYNNTAVVLTVPTFGAWQSIGCYSDTINARTLVNPMTITGPMTVEGCLAACQTANFSFSGLEFGQQCFCGNTFVNGGGPVSTGCDMTCAGNVNEICGGSNRLSVYNNTAIPNNTGMAPPPMALPDHNGWVSLGCYSDNFPAIGQHAINVAVGISGLFTVENCIDFCDAHGFVLAGVEAGNQCYCSSAVGRGSIPVTQGCNMPCQGNTTELCGGSLALNLYIKNYEPPPTILPSYGTWGSLGCYSWEPAPPGFFGFGFNGLTTVEKCTSACQARNFPFAAVSNLGCYCSNSLSGTTPSSIGCILPCNGDRTEFCGNEFYFNGYQNNAFGQFSSATSPITVPGYGYWVSLGCYGGGGLTVDVTASIGGAMTVEKCVTSCAAGLTIAGVKNGNTCLCGNSLTTSVTTGCTTLCAGNSTEFCGGASSLNVYNYTRPFV